MNVDATAVAALNAPPLHGSAPNSGQKLHDAAGQFEAMLIAQMLKSMRENSQDEDDDEASSTYRDMAEQQFAQALSAQGGMGIAKMVEAQLGNRDANQ